MDQSGASSTKFGNDPFPAKADVVVVGGGVIGASTAYHLAKRGLHAVLLEKHELASGTTWHSAGMMTSAKTEPYEIQLIKHTQHLISDVLEKETGVDLGATDNGFLYFSKDPKKMDGFRVMAALSNYFGTNNVFVTPEEMKKIHPLLDVTGVVGGVYGGTDGCVDPTALTKAFAQGAQNNGANVFEHCGVDDFIIEQGKIRGVVTQRGKIFSDSVVLATGAYTKELGALAGLTIPSMVTKHSYATYDMSAEMKENTKLPNIKWIDEFIFQTIDSRIIRRGSLDESPTFAEPDSNAPFLLYDVDLDHYYRSYSRHEKFLPCLKSADRIKQVMCGPESYTPDGKNMFGKTEIHGLYLSCVMNSKGIQFSGGLGREMANLILVGKTEIDLSAYDPLRFHETYINDERWLKEGVHETEIRHYFIGLQGLPRFGARNIRKSPLHDLLTENGAFFGTEVGFEVPKFFLPELGRALEVGEYDWYGNYGHSKQQGTPYKIISEEYGGWSKSPRVKEAIRKEVHACMNDVGLLDMSSYGKIEMSGPSAANLLDFLCTTNVANLGIGSSKHTLMLSKEGCIKGNLVVARTGQDSFYLIMESLALRPVLLWLRKNSEDLGHDIVLKDVTDSMGIVSFHGPNSPDLLKTLTNGEKSSLPLSGTFTTGAINGKTVKIRHASLIGTAGFEIHFEKENCSPILQAIRGKKSDFTLVGTDALDYMSMEAGQRKWNVDICSNDTPVEAGLEFLCENGTKFLGKESMQKQIDEGVNRRLVCFTTPMDSLLCGKEIIHRNGNQLVGYIGRVGIAYSIDKCISFGYIKSNGEEKITHELVMNATYQLEVRGEMVSAAAHWDGLNC